MTRVTDVWNNHPKEKPRGRNHASQGPKDNYKSAQGDFVKHEVQPVPHKKRTTLVTLQPSPPKEQRPAAAEPPQQPHQRPNDDDKDFSDHLPLAFLCGHSRKRRPPGPPAVPERSFREASSPTKALERRGGSPKRVRESDGCTQFAQSALKLGEPPFRGMRKPQPSPYFSVRDDATTFVPKEPTDGAVPPLTPRLLMPNSPEASCVASRLATPRTSPRRPVAPPSNNSQQSSPRRGFQSSPPQQSSGLNALLVASGSARATLGCGGLLGDKSDDEMEEEAAAMDEIGHGGDFSSWSIPTVLTSLKVLNASGSNHQPPSAPRTARSGASAVFMTHSPYSDSNALSPEKSATARLLSNLAASATSRRQHSGVGKRSVLADSTVRLGLRKPELHRAPKIPAYAPNSPWKVTSCVSMQRPDDFSAMYKAEEDQAQAAFWNEFCTPEKAADCITRFELSMGDQAAARSMK